MLFDFYLKAKKILFLEDIVTSGLVDSKQTCINRTLPAGYLEVRESAAEGASRETLEEACADVEIVSPFAQLDIPLIGQ